MADYGLVAWSQKKVSSRQRAQYVPTNEMGTKNQIWWISIPYES